jgi:hypothetical protein
MHATALLYTPSIKNVSGDMDVAGHGMHERPGAPPPVRRKIAPAGPGSSEVGGTLRGMQAVT